MIHLKWEVSPVLTGNVSFGMGYMDDLRNNESFLAL